MRPKPVRETNDLAALESVNKLIGTFELNSNPISRATVCTPVALIAPSTMEKYSASALLNAIGPCVQLQVFTQWFPIKLHNHL